MFRLFGLSMSAAMLSVSVASTAMGASLASYGPNDIIVDGALIPVENTGTLTKRVFVDGHAVSVTVTVANIAFILFPQGGASGPLPTSIRVELDSGDDQDLPAVRATRVRLERVKPPARVYRSTLIPDATLVADPKHIGYGGVLATFHPNARLKATVTLETADETRLVRMGELRVRRAPLVWSGGMREPDVVEE